MRFSGIQVFRAALVCVALGSVGVGCPKQKETRAPDALSAPNAPNAQTAEDDGDLMEALRFFLGDDCTIESIDALPFEWHQAASAMLSFAERYKVQSLDDFRSLDGIEITENEAKRCKGVEDATGYQFEVSETEESIEINITSDSSASQEGLYMWLILNRSPNYLEKLSGADGLWPGFGVLFFFPDGNVRELNYLAEGSAYGYSARFEEDGTMAECYRWSAIEAAASEGFGLSAPKE